MREIAEEQYSTEAATQPSSAWSGAALTVSADVPSLVPTSLIAGRIPVVKGTRPEEAVFNVASLALDTERVALICSVSKGFIHYLACAAADLSSVPRGAGCLLAVALPGMPGHRGAGLYVAQAEGLLACVLLDTRGLRSFIGEPEVAVDFPLTEGADNTPVYRVEAADHGPRLPEWRVFGEMQRATVRRTSNYAASLLTGAALIGCALWGYGVFLNAERDERFTKFKSEAEQLLAARPAQLDNGGLATANQAWRDFAQLSTFCIRQGGKILMFKSDGQKLNWRIELSSERASEAEIANGLGGLAHEVISRGDKWLIQSKEVAR